MISRSSSLLAIAIASAITLSGCGGGPSDQRISTPASEAPKKPTKQETFCSSGEAFVVTNFAPADGTPAWPIGNSVRVEFNADIKTDSLTGNLLLTQGGNEILVDMTPAANAVVLNPIQDLAPKTDFEIIANTDLMADCNTEVRLDQEYTSSFTTGTPESQDVNAPAVTATSPANGKTLVAQDSNILVEFDEAIDPTTVTVSSFIVTKLDENGAPVGVVDGTLNTVGKSVEFYPTANLEAQTFYSVIVGATIADLAGNPLDLNSTQGGSGLVSTFRAGGLVVLLNDSAISQIPGLGDGLNALGGALLSPLEFGEPDDGLSNLDNALLLQIPLVTGLSDLASGAEGLPSATTNPVNGTDFADFTSAAVAVCDPKSISQASPKSDCTLGLDLGLDLTQLQALAGAFTEGDVENIPGLIQEMAAALAAGPSGDFNNLPPELAQLLGNEIFPREDGLGVELRLVDDGGLPVPGQLEDALQLVLDGLNQIPVLGTLFSQNDGLALVNLNLLEGELLGVELGGLLDIGVLSGTQQFLGENGVLNLGGALFDALLMLAPGEGDAPAFDPADLPIIGDLLSLLDAGDFGDIGAGASFLDQLSDLFQLPEGGGFSPDQIPLLGPILSQLDPSKFGDGDIPVIGELLSALDPGQLGGDADALKGIPVLGEIIEQLTNLAGNGGGSSTPGVDELPLLGDLLVLIQGGGAGIPETDTPIDQLSGLLDPSKLQDLPLLGGLLSGLNPAG